MTAPAFSISRATPESRVALAFVALGLAALIAGPYWLDRNCMRILVPFMVYL